MTLRTRYAPRTDDFRQIDLATFPKGLLRYGGSGRLRWLRAGQAVASIDYSITDQGVLLRYIAGPQDNRQAIDELIRFDYAEQPFGGFRKWITCPGCQSRCRVLYGGLRFRCRTCRGATYDSQYYSLPLSGPDRAIRVRERLNGEPDLSWPFPAKPKRMHWQTYRRLQRQDCDARHALECALMLC